MFLYLKKLLYFFKAIFVIVTMCSIQDKLQVISIYTKKVNTILGFKYRTFKKQLVIKMILL